MQEAAKDSPTTREYKPTFWWWLLSVLVVPCVSGAAGWYAKGREIRVSEQRVTVECAGLLTEEQPLRSLAALAWMARSGDVYVALAVTGAETNLLLSLESGVSAAPDGSPPWLPDVYLREVYLAALRRPHASSPILASAMEGLDSLCWQRLGQPLYEDRKSARVRLDALPEDDKGKVFVYQTAAAIAQIGQPMKSVVKDHEAFALTPVAELAEEILEEGWWDTKMDSPSGTPEASRTSREAPTSPGAGPPRASTTPRPGP